MLEAQERAYRGAMKIFLKEVCEQCNELRSTVQDLETSLEFSQNEVDDIKHQLKQLKQENMADKQNHHQALNMSEINWRL